VPTYPYACTSCGHAFEVQQSFSDPSLTECPECAGRLRKVFSSVGVVFKGSGFYRTDSRSGAKTGGGSSGSDSGSASTPSSGSTSDTGSSASKAPASTPSAKPAAASSAPAAAS
jgi:putative FmdB family regulatory protein